MAVPDRRVLCRVRPRRGRRGLLSSGSFTSLIGTGGLAVAPMLLWPLWGVALGAATLAYYLCRSGRCSHCGRR